jgi:hypothetical protein
VIDMFMLDLNWTDEEERLFAEIVTISRGRFTRIQAIQLCKRAKSSPAKARKLAKDAFSDAKIAWYERSRDARLTSLKKATAAAQDARFDRQKRQMRA